jgi:hypothetical protein
MKEEDVLLAPLPQGDGIPKDRPALFLKRMPPFQDYLVCGISTQLQQEMLDFDEIIVPADADFRTSGPQGCVTDPAWLPDRPSALGIQRAHRERFGGSTQALAHQAERFSSSSSRRLTWPASRLRFFYPVGGTDRTQSAPGEPY